MTAQTARIFAHAQKVSAAELAKFYDIALLEQLPLQPKRPLMAWLRDVAYVVAGWAMLIGLIAYPAAHLIGLFACSMALFVSPHDSCLR
jgi:hypothetical protein